MQIALWIVGFVIGAIMLGLGLRRRQRPLIAVGLVLMLVTGSLLLTFHLLGFY
jgi:hypothetical protein